MYIIVNVFISVQKFTLTFKLIKETVIFAIVAPLLCPLLGTAPREVLFYCAPSPELRALSILLDKNMPTRPNQVRRTTNHKNSTRVHISLTPQCLIMY